MCKEVIETYSFTLKCSDLPFCCPCSANWNWFSWVALWIMLKPLVGLHFLAPELRFVALYV